MVLASDYNDIIHDYHDYHDYLDYDYDYDYDHNDRAAHHCGSFNHCSSSP
jgi:hypothetical protein